MAYTLETISFATVGRVEIELGERSWGRYGEREGSEDGGKKIGENKEREKKKRTRIRNVANRRHRSSLTRKKIGLCWSW
jgi:hypothetical protein